MLTWKSHLAAVLERLSRSHPNSTVKNVERLLADVLDAHDVAILDPSGHVLPPTITLDELSRKPLSIAIRVAYAPAGREAGRKFDAEPRKPSGSSVPSAEVVGLSARQREDLFIREMDRLAARHEFMWAGYIVKQLLPRLGYPRDNTKVILDRMHADGLLVINKVPNPNNPGFPATAVKLNCEHPAVQALLGGPKTEGENAVEATPEEPSEAHAAGASGAT